MSQCWDTNGRKNKPAWKLEKDATSCVIYLFLGWILDFLNSLPLFFCITATTSHQHSFCSAREGRARETHGR